MPTTLPVRMTCRIVDALNVEALCSAYALVDPTASFATIVTSLYAWLSAVDALTDGRIVAAQLCALPSLPALKGSPTDTSRVERTGILNFRAPPTTNRWGFAIPALSTGPTVAPDKTIDTDPGTPGGVYIALATTGGSSLEYSNADSQAPLTFADSLISFRLYNRQTAPRTFTVAP